MNDLGARLKQAREERGVSLRDIATRTKIAVVALEALERNDVTRLPGGIFGRAFVRAYAVEIGVDPDETVTDFQALLEESEREAAARGATRVEITQDDRVFLERQRRAVRLLRIGAAVLAILALLALAWRLRPFFQKAVPPAPPAAVVEPPLPPVPVPVPAVASDAPAPDQDARRTPAPSALVVEVGVSANCWIFAAADGVRVTSKLFRPGDSERITAEREVRLDVGNAGAMRWTINGRTAKPLGPPGVRTSATITPGTLATFFE